MGFQNAKGNGLDPPQPEGSLHDLSPGVSEQDVRGRLHRKRKVQVPPGTSQPGAGLLLSPSLEQGRAWLSEAQSWLLIGESGVKNVSLSTGWAIGEKAQKGSTRSCSQSLCQGLKKEAGSETSLASDARSPESTS